MRLRLTIGCALMSSLVLAEGTWDEWPPRAYLIKSLVAEIPQLLAKYHPETGKFGTEPWVYQDQMPRCPLAAAWHIKDDGNPYYHDAKLIEVIARGGEVWLEQQDDQGRYRLLRKNGDDWGLFRSSFVHSHWVKTYHLVKDVLPEASRKKWEQGLIRGLSHMVSPVHRGGVNNQNLRHAMALYIGGVCFGKDEWKATAQGHMARTIAEQRPAGFWTEHSGPVVGYNTAYPWFLGIYYHFSRDSVVLDALRRASQFHVNLLWPDGSFVSCIDERTIYSRAVHIGNPGFATSPVGRAFLLHQLRKHTKDGRRLVPGEYAANMLLYTEPGEVAPLPTDKDGSTVVIGDNDAIIRRHMPWQWAMSAYTCPPTDSRWFQDRQNMIDVFHDEMGLVIGGGNTRLQPYWSTFTVGDPSSLKIEPGQEAPDFTPNVDLRWTPDSATLTADDSATHMRLKYGDIKCHVTVRATEERGLAMTFTAPAGQGVEAHVPVLRRTSAVEFASGKSIALTDSPHAVMADDIGEHFLLGGLKVTVPGGASLRWPARQYNPYRKDGSSSISSAKLVLVLPFESVSTHTITLSHQPSQPFAGLTFDARELPITVSEGTHTRPIDSMDAQFVRFKSANEFITFALPKIEPGRYELLGEFCLAYSYGVVRVSFDAQPVGEPFDCYHDSVDSSGLRVSFGQVSLTEGEHKITVQPTGKNPKSKGMYANVKRWLLKPLD